MIAVRKATIRISQFFIVFVLLNFIFLRSLCEISEKYLFLFKKMHIFPKTFDFAGHKMVSKCNCQIWLDLAYGSNSLKNDIFDLDFDLCQYLSVQTLLNPFGPKLTVLLAFKLPHHPPDPHPHHPPDYGYISRHARLGKKSTTLQFLPIVPTFALFLLSFFKGYTFHIYCHDHDSKLICLCTVEKIILISWKNNENHDKLTWNFKK